MWDSAGLTSDCSEDKGGDFVYLCFECWFQMDHGLSLSLTRMQCVEIL